MTNVLYFGCVMITLHLKHDEQDHSVTLLHNHVHCKTGSVVMLMSFILGIKKKHRYIKGKPCSVFLSSSNVVTLQLITYVYEHDE